MTNMDITNGVWYAPAGTGTALAGVVQAERQLAPSDLNALNISNVNAIKTQPDGSILIWGTRTMEKGYASLYVPVRRTLNYIEWSLADLLSYLVFQPNDSLTWANATATANQFLAGLYGQNAFPGTTPQESYYVTCDATTNTPSQIELGILTIIVGVALMIPAEFIALNIQQFQATGTTTVTTATAQ
jgi:hypothetical protein